MIRNICVLILVLASSAAFAKNVAVETCIELAAKAYKIDPLPLYVIRRVEGGQPGTVSRNANLSADVGPFQVNTVHLATFKAFGISYEDLRDNVDCKNVWAAAYLFRKHLIALDGDVALAIAHYHSKTPQFAYRYLTLVHKAIDREIAERERIARRAKQAPRFASTE